MNFKRFNDNTIPGKKVLLDEIEQTLKDGYAIDNGEEVTGIICVAAPVLGYRQYPVASIWLTGPDFRMKEKGLEHIGATVANFAGQISRRFGFDQPGKS